MFLACGVLDTLFAVLYIGSIGAAAGVLHAACGKPMRDEEVLRMTDNVTLFRTRQEKACSRNRNEALGVLIPHLLGALAETGEKVSYPPDPKIHTLAQSCDLVLTSTPTVEGLYFSVFHGRHRVLTGYLNPRDPGNYLDGKVHVMTWNRGEWQADLFDAFRTRPLPILS